MLGRAGEEALRRRIELGLLLQGLRTELRIQAALSRQRPVLRCSYALGDGATGLACGQVEQVWRGQAVYF